MNKLLIDGLALMFIGMGTVLIFLCIMIFAMFIMGAVVKVLNKLFPEAVVQQVSASKAVPSDDGAIAAAIIAAITRKK